MQSLGRPTSVRLCATAATGQHCVPPAASQRPSGAGATQPELAQGAEWAPIARALRGEVGMSQWPDDRRRMVFAAYRPVIGLGLGMVVTQDAAELYNPVSVQLLRLLPVIGLLVLAGVWLLNLGIKPLVRRLVGAHHELQAKSALEHAILDSADYAVIAADPRGVVCAFNRAAERMLGYPADAVVGRRTVAEWHDPAELRQHAADIANPGDAPPAGAEILAYRPRQGEAEEREWTFVRADGERLSVWLNVTPLRDLAGEFTGLLAIADDISESKQVEEHLRLLATTDALTGLVNRNLFYDRLTQAMARAQRSGDAMALLYLDIDRFKQVNDSLGHATGDTLLRAFAIRLRDTLRQSDTVARLGGNEFTVLIEGLAEPQAAEATTAKILNAVRRPFDLDGTALHVSVSIGVALYDVGEGMSAEALLKHAEEALYAAKGAGRNGFQIYADAERLLSNGRLA